MPPDQEIPTTKRPSEMPGLRKYQAIWLRLMEEEPGTKVRIQIRNSALFLRTRKAVRKEKDIDPVWVKIKDADNSEIEVLRKTLYRLHCEFFREDGVMVFFVTENLIPEDV